MEWKEVSANRSFSGWQKVYDHESEACNGTMRFGLYQPENVDGDELPLFVWLSGLTCTHENFVTKSGFQAMADKFGIYVLAPDTSPRNQNFEGEDDSWDFGTAAGFYLDATQEPWSKAYNMESYLIKELIPQVIHKFPIDRDCIGISGHSMGGHGALTLGLKHSDLFSSVSAFAPICAPSQCPWGEKALGNYLGQDKEAWKDYDACELIKAGKFQEQLLIDQGVADQFLKEQLHPHLLVEACKDAGIGLELRMHQEFDHSYYFVASFLEDHFHWHLSQWG